MSRSSIWRILSITGALTASACSKSPDTQPPAVSDSQPSTNEPAAAEAEPVTAEPPAPHTEADRLALFDDLVDKTLRRHAFSEVKWEKLGLDFETDAAPLRDAFAAAESDLDLFRALCKLSAVRRDAHMKVSPIEGGLPIDGTEYASGIEFSPDFERLDEHVFCVQRVSYDVESGETVPAIGDVLVSINGQSPAEFDETIGPYLLWSTPNNRAWSLAEACGRQFAYWPTLPESHEFVYQLRNAERGEYEVRLTGMNAEDISWPPQPSRTFPGFALSLSLPSFDMYRPADGQNIVAFEWKDFEKDHLTEDLSHLTAYASGNQLFDHDMIVDFTRSSGGSDGVLALQVLVGRPFKTTFGDLRISDVIEPFIISRERSPRLRDWLHEDVRGAAERGEAYTAPVPFKLRHLPRESDGTMEPAPQHFTGRMVCLFGSQVGSQVDQIASMVIDNGLCHSIGMPTGGYSNTWEWEENVTIPATGRPLAEFIWSMGRTYRPNGEELEGNPPMPDELVLLSSENVADYHDRLLQRAVEYLAEEQ